MKVFGTILILTTLVFSTAQAQEGPCAGKAFTVKAPGFFGFNRDAKTARQIIQIVPNSVDHPTTFNNAIEIGRYRFVKNGSQIDIYRKNDQGVYELKTDVRFPLRVFTDNPIMVTIREGHVIEVRRNGDDTVATTLQAQFFNDRIDVRSETGKRLLSHHIIENKIEKSELAVDATAFTVSANENAPTAHFKCGPLSEGKNSGGGGNPVRRPVLRRQ